MPVFSQPLEQGPTQPDDFAAASQYDADALRDNDVPAPSRFTPADLYAARLLRLVTEAREIAGMIRDAHAYACLSIPPSEAQETDLRIVESEFAFARRALKRLAGRGES